MKKLVYVGFSFLHHKNTHAGFNRIKNYIQYDYIVSSQKHRDACDRKVCFITKCYRRIVWWIFGTPVIPYYILKCIWLGLTHRDLVFHFIYGENDYYKLSRFIWPQNKIVCTFHQPFEWFEKKNWEKKLLSIDKITVLSDKEIDRFKKITGKNNVAFTPHGISTDFYKPDLNVKKEKMILTVGNWLRDYEFADKVYQKLLSEAPDLHIVVVSNKENQKLLTPHERLSFMSGITDEELLNLYLRCSVLFLPLIRYTANNSLLEAAACGCNIVIASDSPDNSYIPNNYLSLCKMNETETIATINSALTTEYNIQLSDYVKENYSWEVVAKKMEEYLKSF